MTMLMQTRGRLLALPLIAALALSTACRQAHSESPVASAEAAPIAVSTETVSAVEVPQVLRLTGTLRGNREADLAANAAGRVLATAVERGDAVKPGQMLARLDVRAASLSAREAQVQAASARAQDEQARLECKRYDELRKKGAVNDLEYDQKMTQCRTLPLSAQAASVRASLAAQNVGDGVIRAPFAGVVSQRYVEAGQYLHADSPVVTLLALDPLRLEISVEEADSAKVREGEPIEFTVAAYPGRRFVGEVRFISGALRANTRDLVVEAVVANGDRALKPGMFADVELRVGTERLAALQKAAIFERDGQSHAFFAVNGRLEERVLATGPALGEQVSVRTGAAAGEHVVVGDLAALSNGQRVR
jgi:RND family efflux transporter MFP subunit